MVIVVLIIGILAGIAAPNYIRIQERAKAQEAIAILKLIRSAQEIYQSQWGTFYGGAGGTSDINAINGNLSLDINEINWDYDIAMATASAFSAKADRQGNGGYLDCLYGINESSVGPVVISGAGTCP